MDTKIEEVLKELKRERGEFWNVPRSSGEFLNALAGFLGAVNILEIGTSNGYSGIWLAEAVSKGGGKLVSVESHEERFREATKNFKKAGLDKYVLLVKGHAPEVLFEFDKIEGMDVPSEFDMVFIDATKMEYMSYLDEVLPMLKKGGLLVADNCLSHFEDLQVYIKEVTSRKDLNSFLLSLDNGLSLSFKLTDS